MEVPGGAQGRAFEGLLENKAPENDVLVETPRGEQFLLSDKQFLNSNFLHMCLHYITFVHGGQFHQNYSPWVIFLN